MRVEYILSDVQHQALINSAVQLIDELFLDLLNQDRGPRMENTLALAHILPPQFSNHYDELFIKEFIVCAVRVADRLAEWDEKKAIPACTAESLALLGIVELAKTWLELRDYPEEEMDFNVFMDIAFPDLDVKLLFDPALDGIEDTFLAQQMGMVLKPSDWFLPTYGHVHPYVTDEDPESE